MPDFKDAAVWKKWFFLCIMLAITHLFFSFASGIGGGASRGAEFCVVVGYLGLIVGAVLALGILFTDELNGNKIALICFVVFAFLGGVMTLIGIAIWGGDVNKHKDQGYSLGMFATMLGVMAALFGILAGIFGVLDLVGVGAAK